MIVEREPDGDEFLFARIAELEAENARLLAADEQRTRDISRLTMERDEAREALARTGAVKVTEAMVEAAREIIHGARHVYSDIDLARAALKAAMEAGR